MRLVKTRPKYRCGFCRFTATEKTVVKHEGFCFRNPNRFCDWCKNKGFTVECHGDLVEDGDCGLSEEYPCPFCSKFKPLSELTSLLTN